MGTAEATHVNVAEHRSTSAHLWKKAAIVSFTIENVNYARLATDRFMRPEVEAAIKKQVSTQAGAGIGSQDVSLVISEGSWTGEVAVEATIMLPSPVGIAFDVESKLSSSTSLINNVASAVAGVDNIATVSKGQGPITVSAIHVSTLGEGERCKHPGAGTEWSEWTMCPR